MKKNVKPGKKRRDAEGQRIRQHPTKPDLMAPAGSPATWAAAVEAGADVVYLGLKDFSARAFAANFTLDEMSRLVPLSHERGTKIFVTFNALLKENEIGPACRTLDALAKIGPDGLIIQDLGLLNVVKKDYPQFRVHASTLMAVHNRPGLDALAGLGFDLAVLARELTLSEIEYLAEKSPLGLEIFIHGALCFSFSGLCLMSSFLGGKGSLRGACTQPCRRLYTSGKKKGYFFSPTDLDTAELMDRLRTLPLTSLKIEGRMKGAAYVSRVVRAYRLLLDTPREDLGQALVEARALLDASLGRQRSTGFFLTPHPAAGLSSTQGTTSGLFLGRVTESSSKGGRINLLHPLEVGDRLRVQFKKDDERQAFTLKEMSAGDLFVKAALSGETVALGSPVPLAEGDMVFKVDTAGGEKEALASPLAKALKGAKSGGSGKAPRKFQKEGRDRPAPESLARTKGSPQARGRSQGQGGRPQLWYRLNRTEDVRGLEQVRPDRIILPLTRQNVKRMAGSRRRLGALASIIIWSFPPLVFDHALPGMRQDLAQLAKMGEREFMIANLGHLPLLKGMGSGRRAPVVYADHRVNCLNTRTEALLAGLGLNGVTLSIENDEDNLKQMIIRPGPVHRLLYLFGRPALFTSRFNPSGLKDNLPVESPRGGKVPPLAG